MTEIPAVLVERAGGLATVTLNRPERRNAIGAGMMPELHAALADIARDGETRVLILTGAGADFCPGADVKEIGGGGGRGALLHEFEIPVLLHAMPAVTIAAVAGACAGAGFGWACACDFRLASDTAVFNTAFLDVGVAGDMGGPWSLSRIIGAAKARELYFLPGKFGAAEALRIGLVSAVSPAERFKADAAAVAGRLLAAAPLALAAMKANFLAAETQGFAEFIGLETERHLRLFRTEDTLEAFRARAEKRPPVFKGR